MRADDSCDNPNKADITLNLYKFPVYMQKTAKFSGAPPLTPRLRRASEAGTSVFPPGGNTVIPLNLCSNYLNNLRRVLYIHTYIVSIYVDMYKVQCVTQHTCHVSCVEKILCRHMCRASTQNTSANTCSSLLISLIYNFIHVYSAIKFNYQN